jgi:hypothetical protein
MSVADLDVGPSRLPGRSAKMPGMDEHRDDEPHDILAAEEFPGPAPEQHDEGPLVLPPDPRGENDEPHDVLAAEEFPMPAPPRHAHPPRGRA